MAGHKKLVTNGSKESFFTCMSELICWVGTKNTFPGAAMHKPVGWKVVRDFVRSARAVVKKAKKNLQSGSGGLEYWLAKETVGPREYVVHQWFHLVEGDYPAVGEEAGFPFNDNLDAMWTEIVQGMDEADEASESAKGKKDARKAQEANLIEAGATIDLGVSCWQIVKQLIKLSTRVEVEGASHTQDGKAFNQEGES